MKALILVLALAATPALAHPCKAKLPPKGATFAGEVRYLMDGDTLCVGPGADPVTWVPVRLADFYAPEKSEPGGAQATTALREIAFGQWVVCTGQHASFERRVAVCELGGFPLGDLMRGQGVAEGGRGR